MLTSKNPPCCYSVAKLCNPMDCSTPSFTISQSLLKFMSAESVRLSNHLILCCHLLLQPSLFPSIRIISNKSASGGASASEVLSCYQNHSEIMLPFTKRLFFPYNAVPLHIYKQVTLHTNKQPFTIQVWRYHRRRTYLICLWWGPISGGAGMGIKYTSQNSCHWAEFSKMRGTVPTDVEKRTMETEDES